MESASAQVVHDEQFFQIHDLLIKAYISPQGSQESIIFTMKGKHHFKIINKLTEVSKLNTEKPFRIFLKELQIFIGVTVYHLV